MNPALITLKPEGLDSPDEFVQIRRDIHQHPELGFEEHRTSQLVAERLQSWGYEVTRGLGGTGVVGQLKKGSSDRRLGLRADMDALPITEKTHLGWASRAIGKMHACGHDGHTAMLLAAAHHLAKKGQFEGTLNLIFQPAEEGLGGARQMMEDGLFRQFPCDAVFAMHNMPGLPQGTFVLRPGPAMASSDYVTITLEGVGGHGAYPHQAVDPIVGGASIVMALQTIVSRNVSPTAAAVITVGSFQSGSANNVIPDKAVLQLSVRAIDRQVRVALEEKIHRLVQAQAESLGLKATVDYRRGYPVLVNTEAETALARQVALDMVGEAGLSDKFGAQMGSEDFAYFLEEVPGCYVWLGNCAGDSRGACMVHNPGYDFNDAILPVGAAYWVSLTQRFLSVAADAPTAPGSSQLHQGGVAAGRRGVGADAALDHEAV